MRPPGAVDRERSGAVVWPALLGLLVLFVVVWSLGCAHLGTARCTAKAIADALACFPATSARKAPMTGEQRAVCDAARALDVPGWREKCEEVIK